MHLSIATTRTPATDLGFLLMKHPDRVHETEFAFGKATVFFPEATATRCEAALTIDVDPVALVRGRGTSDGLLDQYVNDRPYAASSFLSVAINRVFRTAMTGTSKERQALADTPIPLDMTLLPLPVRGGDGLVNALFEPLGWHVSARRIDGPTGPSRYVALNLSGDVRLADALSHLYVLIPVLDDDKHYWVGDDEVEKLLGKGGAWLAGHPEKELIARRYLKNQRGLARAALARLVPEEADDAAAAPERRDAPEEALEKPIRLHELRLDTVAAALAAAGAQTVADLGCGSGKLLSRLVRDRRFTRLIGLDASARALEEAARRLKLDLAGGPAAERVQLIHGALTYRDARWESADAAVLVEVIEHLDPDRLPALTQVVFGAARPKIVIVTTPNADYNALFPSLPAGALRHPDHRFEWTRAEFAGWVDEVKARFGYDASVTGIGSVDDARGAPSQMAVFSR